MRFLKSILIVFTVLVVAVAALLVLFYFATGRSAVYLQRTALWGSSDVNDHRRFPERAIQNASPTFYFNEAYQPSRFQEMVFNLEDRPAPVGLDELLAGSGTTSFIVLRDDTILYEKYLNGYARDSIVTSFSSVKSINSALIGIAIDEGLIGSVDDPVVRYLPELEGRNLNKLTVRHLLDMSSGIRYVEDENLFLLFAPLSDDAKTYYYPDLRRLALSVQPGDEPVGEFFHYNNYHPLLEGLILERVTGMPVADYLQEKIWKPLGMEFPASWSLDSVESGFEKMESGLNARAVDFAKFGRLFLNGGNWNGRQIISAAWVKESTTRNPQDRRPWKVFSLWQESGGYYAYHWWGLAGEGHDDFMARGHLGQYIYICPQKRLVMVRYGWEAGPPVSWPRVFQEIERNLP